MLRQGQGPGTYVLHSAPCAHFFRSHSYQKSQCFLATASVTCVHTHCFRAADRRGDVRWAGPSTNQARQSYTPVTKQASCHPAAMAFSSSPQTRLSQALDADGRGTHLLVVAAQHVDVGGGADDAVGPHDAEVAARPAHRHSCCDVGCQQHPGVTCTLAQLGACVCRLCSAQGHHRQHQPMQPLQPHAVCLNGVVRTGMEACMQAAARGLPCPQASRQGCHSLHGHNGMDVPPRAQPAQAYLVHLGAAPVLPKLLFCSIQKPACWDSAWPSLARPATKSCRCCLARSQEQPRFMLSSTA